MEWGIVRNGIVFFFLFVCVFFLIAFGVLYFLPLGTVLNISLWWEILLPLVCFLIHMYIGFFTEGKALFYSGAFNVILWGLWLLFLIWFLPMLLNVYTVIVPMVLLTAVGFLGSMLGKSMAGVVAANRPPTE